MDASFLKHTVSTNQVQILDKAVCNPSSYV